MTEPSTPRTSTRLRHRRWPVWVAAIALTASIAACGSSSPSSSPSKAAGTTTATSGGTASDTGSADTGSSTPAAPIANAVTVTAPGMSYDVSGTLKPGVAAITFRNTDEVSHMMAIARLKDGVTLDQLKTALAKSEDAANALLADGPDGSTYGTPDVVGPGQSNTVTALDLKAGNYGLICFLTDDQGTPHFQMGMIGELKVAGPLQTEKPNSDGDITLDDQGITLPDGFTGKGTFLVTNKGTKTHNITFVRLDTGTALATFAGAIGEAQNNNKSIDVKGGVLVGGISDLNPGQSAYLTLDLPPGHYGYVSPDDAQGPELPPQHGEFDVS